MMEEKKGRKEEKSEGGIKVSLFHNVRQEFGRRGVKTGMGGHPVSLHAS